jgi:hypothetical protein
MAEVDSRHIEHLNLSLLIEQFMQPRPFNNQIEVEFLGWRHESSFPS